MKLGIGNLNCIAIRIEASDTSEMVSQLLFGETFKVIESDNDWIKIILDFDFYEGWILKNQVQLLDEKTYNEITENNTTVSK